MDSDGTRVRKFVGCILALAKSNAAIQDLLVQEGLRRMVRKCLVEHSTVSFHGEFTDLRDWIRGDRGGAKSAVTARGRRDPSIERHEKNTAETALSKGLDDDGYGPTSHVAAARVAGFTSPAQRGATAGTRIRFNP